MRVALIGPVHPYRGGIAHYTTLLDAELRARGNPVLLVSYRRQYPDWLFPGHSDKDPSDQPFEAPNAQYWLDSLNPLTWVQTFTRIRAYRPDIVVLQWWSTFWAPVLITLMLLNRWLLRRPVLIICHNVLPHETRHGDVLLTKMTLRMATHCVVQSAEEERRLHLLVPQAATTIASLPIFDMFTENRVDQSTARSQLGLPSEVPILLFFGIVRPYKGLRELIEAFPNIRARIDDVRLVVAGEFWEDKADYLLLIEELNLSDVVTVDDRYVPNEEVALYFSAADALVAPYKFRTGSGVSQLAVAFHLPVILAPTEDQLSEPQPGVQQPSRADQIEATVVAYFQNGAGREAPEADREVLAEAAWDRLIGTIEECATTVWPQTS